MLFTWLSRGLQIGSVDRFRCGMRTRRRKRSRSNAPDNIAQRLSDLPDRVALDAARARAIAEHPSFCRIAQEAIDRAGEAVDIARWNQHTAPVEDVRQVRDRTRHDWLPHGHGIEDLHRHLIAGDFAL